MVKLKMIQKRTCMNCSHLRRLADGYVSCDMEWFWNKFRKERRNVMRLYTIEKKGEKHARECPDFDNKHTKNLSTKKHQSGFY